MNKLAIILTVVTVVGGCWYTKDKAAELAVPTVSPEPVRTGVVATPSSPPPKKAPEPAWKRLELSEDGEYASSASCAVVRSKKGAEEPWTLPYPYHLKITGAEGLDCGFFDDTPVRWVAYCLEENDRMLHTIEIWAKGDEREFIVSGKKYSGYKLGCCVQEEDSAVPAD